MSLFITRNILNNNGKNILQAISINNINCFSKKSCTSLQKLNYHLLSSLNTELYTKKTKNINIQNTLSLNGSRNFHFQNLLNSNNFNYLNSKKNLFVSSNSIKCFYSQTTKAENKNKMVKCTWLGHSAFQLEHNGFKFLIDPFLSNPNCPLKETPTNVDAILITHGHDDHLGETVEIIKKNPKCKTFTNVEIADYITKKSGSENVHGFNKGGTLDIGGNFKVTMVDAVHSSDITDDDGTIIPGGLPGGFVIQGNNLNMYFAGDTDAFSDMKIINDYYNPKYAFLPIGDYFTMDGKKAAFAVNNYLQDVETIIPMHYGTFPILTGTPEQLKENLKTKATVKVLEFGVPVEL